MDFNNTCATPPAADAHKRVNYTYGLVLGVGEFRTEQNYSLAKHRRHARSLHGYGTVAGLALSVRDTANGPELRVSPGLAIDPHGREICVPEAQCALLDGWLLQRRQQGDLSPPDSSPPGHVTAYVTLCYRECETDKVPIPVGPCQSLDKSSVASRIQDAFELCLADTPPAQVEEEALWQLSDLMSRVKVAAQPGALTTPDALIAEIRALAPALSPPASPGSMPAEIVLDPQHAAEIMRAALRAYVTEVRPALIPEGGGCLEGPRDATCVLLARLDFDVHDAGGVPQVAGSVQISEDERPLLFSTRMLQQAVLDGGGGGGGGGSSGTGTRSLVLAPSAAESVSGATLAALGDLVPALRFKRNDAAVFSFAPPADLDPGAPLELRLAWAFRGNQVAALGLTWTATLRLLSVGDDLGTPPSAATATFHPATAATDLGRLLDTGPSPLTLPAPPSQPMLGALELRLTSTASIPNSTEIYIASAELRYATRGGL